MRSLLWKEWHEQRWKLAFTTLLLAGFTFCGLHARILPDDSVLALIYVLAIVILPLLIGATLIAAERDSKTLNTLLALPASPSSILAAKTIAGLVLCIVPLGVDCILAVLLAGNREASTAWIASLFFRCMVTTAVLFFWMLAFTIRIPGETRATLVSLGILIGWGIVFQGTASNQSLFWLINPLMLFKGLGNGNWIFSLPLDLLIQAVIACLLWLWAARQLAAEEARS